MTIIDNIKNKNWHLVGQSKSPSTGFGEGYECLKLVHETIQEHRQNNELPQWDLTNKWEYNWNILHSVDSQKYMFKYIVGWNVNKIKLSKNYWSIAISFIAIILLATSLTLVGLPNLIFFLEQKNGVHINLMFESMVYTICGLTTAVLYFLVLYIKKWRTKQIYKDNSKYLNLLSEEYNYNQYTTAVNEFYKRQGWEEIIFPPFDSFEEFDGLNKINNSKPTQIEKHLPIKVNQVINKINQNNMTNILEIDFIKFADKFCEGRLNEYLIYLWYYVKDIDESLFYKNDEINEKFHYNSLFIKYVKNTLETNDIIAWNQLMDNIEINKK